MINVLEKKSEHFTRNIILSLSVIGLISLIIRLYNFPFDIPLTLDAQGYFWYAVDMSILGKFPTGYYFPNNGWPAFLTLFFSIFHSGNFVDYMTVQRLVTVSISIMTIVPVYLLCRRFFDKQYALVGASLFGFEPRIVQNSILGLTDPLYIFLMTCSLFFVLSTNKKFVYLSFGLAALGSLVRYEGLLLFVVISIMFFVKFRKERKIIMKYVLAVVIFILVLLPMAYIRVQTTGNNGLTNQITAGAIVSYRNASETGTTSSAFLYVLSGFVNLIKYLGWVTIPIFVFFVPYGVLLIFKNRNQNNMMIILSLIILSIPAFYAYSRGIQETRYLYVLYPLFCILSLHTAKSFSDKFRNRNLILILLMVSILALSITFLELKKTDNEHEKEAFYVAQRVSSLTRVINEYSPESRYIQVSTIPENHFPVLRSSLSPTAVQLSIEANSLEEYIKSGKEMGLTHLVIDDKQDRPSYFKNVFYHEKQYPYLIKIFDSSDYGYKYHVKIFKIDYNQFNPQPSINK